MAMPLNKINLVGLALFGSPYAKVAERNLALQAMCSALCGRGREEPDDYRLMRHLRRMTTRPVYTEGDAD